MKILFTTFATPSDFDCLESSDNSLISLGFDHTSDRVIVVESHEEAAEYRGRFRTQVSGFARGATLDGIACVMGMIETWKDILARNPSVTHIAKMDADVLLNGTKFVDVLSTGNFDHVGHLRELTIRVDGTDEIRSQLSYACGSFYILSREIIEAMPSGEALRVRLSGIDDGLTGHLSMKRISAPSWPEDETISSLTRELGARIAWEGDHCPFGIWTSWRHMPHQSGEFSIGEAARCKSFDAIDFGRTATIASEAFPTRESRRAVTEKIMVTFLGHNERMNYNKSK